MKGNKMKKVSLILSIIMMIPLVGFNQRTVADSADILDKPTFDLEMTATPDPAMVGEDITVSGVIKPKDFETEIPAKEIVIVLDTSGSMADSITINGKKTTKMQELKKAAKSFIETMKSVENLEIAIVQYSSLATINPISKSGKIRYYDYTNRTERELIKYNSTSELFLDINDLRIETIISNLEADGGTNTGEGLRKAIYALQSSSNKDANRSIVLMSDGLPTFLSADKISEGWGRYRYDTYYNIDNSQISNVKGKGSGLDTDSINYAKYMGEIIKQKGYNTYSIGYGMDYDGNKTLKEIHKSMTGNELGEDVAENEKKGYYQTSNNIEGIFNNIATEILNSYPVNNVALNITFEEGFTLNIDGNKVDIGNIIYKKALESSSSNKVKYEADEVPFSFIVKASKVGQQTISDKINISYVFNNESLNHDVVKRISINVESNELPKIGASLVSEKNLTLTKGEEFIVKYKLSPQDFEFKDVNNATEKDVTIVIDTSSKVSDTAFNSLKKSMFSKLLNNTILRNSKTNYSVITFSNNAEILSDFTSNISNLNEIIENISKTSSDKADLDSTIKLINQSISKGRSEASKNIIIIAQDNVDYTESKIDELESKGYNIILLSLGTGENSKLIDLKNNKELLIEEESIFKTGSEGENVEKTYIGKVAERLISSTKYKPYIFNPEINMSLLGNFEVIEGATMINETNAKLVSEKKVVYNNIGNNKYHAEPIEIEFTVRVKAENPGDYVFGATNLKHENLIGGYKDIVLETPEVTVKEAIKDLVHGLYSGLSGSEIIIEKPIEENGFKIIGGATLTFGAKFKTSTDKVKATLNIDSDFDLSNGTFEIYKVDKSGETSKLVKLEQLDNKIKTNSLDININNIGTNGIETQLVIVYKVKVKENSVNELFQNKITIGKLNESTNIYTPATPIHNEDDPMDKIPDLF